MTFAEPSAEGIAGHVNLQRVEREWRWWLVAALLVSMVMAVFYFRSLGPFDAVPTNVTVLRSVDVWPLVAIAALVVLGGGRFRWVGAIIAYLAAVNMVWIVYMIAIFPGGAPDTSDPGRPPLLDGFQSLVGVTVAVTLVMILASFYARGRLRIGVNVCTFLYLGANIASKAFIYR